MKVPIKKLGVKEAEEMVNILNEYSCEAKLTSNQFVVDAKSILGVIAASYYDNAALEISELDPALYGELNSKLIPFYKIQQEYSHFYKW